MQAREPWKVSLHGGHSWPYCDHAEGSLREILEKAVAVGYHTFGVTEHAPRLHERFLYAEERELGWDVEKLSANFKAYARDLEALADEFSGRIAVLRGFEAEVVPADRYGDVMSGYRDRYRFDYMVGSVHYVGETLVDGPLEDFEGAVETHGGLENLASKYYETVTKMVEALEPEVVGHLDIIRRNAPSDDSLETPRVRRAAEETLETIRAHDCILDLNTRGYRKGLGRPYPSPWLVQTAHRMGIGFCFGDDSHGPKEVGAHIDEARAYLLEQGVGKVTFLTREGGVITKKTASLE